MIVMDLEKEVNVVTDTSFSDFKSCVDLANDLPIKFVPSLVVYMISFCFNVFSQINPLNDADSDKRVTDKKR